ncbi:MAG: HAMP domain-containing histidine kinase, partial [bacterium]|nr:HAMP domain-containing histidine kinase [bacterium]
EKLRKTSCNLSLTNEELRKANEVKSELLGLAAHDLKNPLQVIIGYTNLLKMKMKKDPKVFEKLNMINISSDKMLKLITQLLETSAIDNGKLRLNLTLVDIGELAENVISVMKPLAERKRQTIIFRADKECIVNGDQMLLQEVMDNLISNAVKFSPFDKTIYVSVDRSLSSSVICFAVRDEGPGLTLDDKCKLFEKYCRLSAKPTGGESSTGLGLSIIRDLVELHNGKIRVDGEPGKGSTFTVHLPMLT